MKRIIFVLTLLSFVVCLHAQYNQKHAESVMMKKIEAELKRRQAAKEEMKRKEAEEAESKRKTAEKTNSQNERLAKISANDYMHGPSTKQASANTPNNKLKILEQNRNVHYQWNAKATRFVPPHMNIPHADERTDQHSVSRTLSPDLMQKKYKPLNGTILYSSQVKSKEPPSYNIYSDNSTPSKNASKSRKMQNAKKKDNSVNNEPFSTISLIMIPKGEKITVGGKNDPIPVTRPQPNKEPGKTKGDGKRPTKDGQQPLIAFPGCKNKISLSQEELAMWQRRNKECISKGLDYMINNPAKCWPPGCEPDVTGPITNVLIKKKK